MAGLRWLEWRKISSEELAPNRMDEGESEYPFLPGNRTFLMPVSGGVRVVYGIAGRCWPLRFTLYLLTQNPLLLQQRLNVPPTIHNIA